MSSSAHTMVCAYVAPIVFAVPGGFQFACCWVMSRTTVCSSQSQARFVACLITPRASMSSPFRHPPERRSRPLTRRHALLARAATAGSSGPAPWRFEGWWQLELRAKRIGSVDIDKANDLPRVVSSSVVLGALMTDDVEPLVLRRRLEV